MHADLWGLVFRFALRLDLLDYACLDDLCSFALVDRGAATAIARLARPELKLRVRVHRLFEFRSPLKSQVIALLPRFAETLPSGSLCLSLAQVSSLLVEQPDAPAWVSWAEGLPARRASRKRAREHKQDQRALRQRLIQDQLAERGLPFEPRSNSVKNFLAGRTKTPEAVFKAMELVKQDRAVEDFVAARDAQSLLEPHARLAQLARLAQRHSVNLPPGPPAVPRCPARLLGLLWLRHAKPPSSGLERKLALRAGRELVRKGWPPPRDDFGLDLEAGVWMRAARRLNKEENH
jgi:hypothetical protein